MEFTPSALKPLLAIAIKNKSVPFILGAPGIGKSALVRSIAKDMDTKLFVVSGNLLSDKADLTGVMKKTLPDGSVAQAFYPHLTIQESITYANDNPDKTVLLMLDEINRAPEDVMTGLMSLSTERRIGNVDLPSNISIILAGNDSGNVNVVDSATLSRSVIYKMIPSAADLLKSNAGKAFDQDTITWLTNEPTNVFSAAITTEDEDGNNGSHIDNEMGEDFDQFTTPRTIEKLSEFIKEAKTTDLWENLLNEYAAVNSNLVSDDKSPLIGIIYAHIGHTAAANKFLDSISSFSSVAGNVTSIKPVPDSVLAQLTEPDVNTLVSDLRTEFVNDNELASRTLVGLAVRGATPAMPAFPMNFSAYGELIDMIFDVYPQAQTTLITELSNIKIISKAAKTAIDQSNNAHVRAFANILESLVTGNVISVQN